MASEIRVNSLTNRSGLSTVSITDTGAVISGIVTVSDTINAQSNINVSTNLSVSGVSTLGNTVVGGATTELIVGGDARITGILTIGTSSITLDGSNNTITSSNFVGNLSGNVVTTGVSTFKSLDYAGISSTISDTAVDVFVYDTSKDSDGGAWRYKTQRTSWYNETLNTATRGSRREFPSVAVIVAESSTVTIYDGDDPDLPMWMVFPSSSSLLTSGGTTPNPSLSALNGDLVFGDSSSYYGALRINFISEKIIGYHDNSSFFGLYKYNISQRSLSNSTSDFVGNSTNYALVNRYVKDVAMTVLPNAPIDSATGLPIPTIAVATNGGVSVIKDDGTVVDVTANNSDFNDTRKISFSGQKLCWVYSYLGLTDDTHTVFIDIPSSDTVISAHSSAINYSFNSSLNSPPFIILYPNFVLSLGNTILETSKNNLFAGNIMGIANLSLNNGSPSNSMVSIAATSYNTGWMHGNIKGAWLSDTSTASVTGTALLTGQASTYDVNTTNGGWTSQASASNAYNATNGVSGTGCIRLTSSGGSSVWNSLSLGTVTSGAKYSITFSAKIASSAATSFTVSQSQYNVGSAYGSIAPTVTTSHLTYSFIFTASSTTAWFNVYAGQGSGSALDLDNIDIRLLSESDRSVNNNGLAVYGTITKSAVATGAELVAYSGFSASNYLQQPYNSALDFGTGDLSVMFWYKSTSGSSQCLLHRGDGVAGGGGWGSGPIIQIEFNGTNLAAFLSDAAFGSYDTIGIPIATSANSVWNHYVLTRSGGTMGVYFNGSLYGRTSSTRTLTNTAARTWIGERPNASRPATNTSLALYRMGASAPSAEQIKKIYEDEKALFQPNSQCTLYGSSDAVTALAYDEVNDLLHVGTSSGRSDFNGLRRINNTTTAVTTAISAYDGLIAAQ